MKIRILIFFLFITLNSFSQILDVERYRLSDDTSRHHFNGKVGSSFQSLKNNNKTMLSFGINADGFYQWKSQKIIYLGNCSAGSINNSSFSNDGYQHFRYTKNVTDSFIVEAFSQIAYNKILKLKLRSLSGFGIRYKIINAKNIIVSLAMIYMYEYENNYDNTYLRDIRMSDYVSMKIRLHKKITFINTTYYQPLLADMDNILVKSFSQYRISSHSSLQIKLIDKLFFSINYDLYYNTDPPEGVQNTNYNLLNTLTYIL